MRNDLTIRAWLERDKGRRLGWLGALSGSVGLALQARENNDLDESFDTGAWLGELPEARPHKDRREQSMSSPRYTRH